MSLASPAGTVHDAVVVPIDGAVDESPSGVRRAALLAVVVFIGILFALFLFELVFRLFQSRLQPRLWSDRPASYYVPPHATSLRDFGYSDVKPANTFRIGVVGDSFTFGPYLQFDDTFPKRLERMFQYGETDGSERVEVISYGTPGYSTAQELDLMRRAVSAQADLAILEITLNDPELHLFTRTGAKEHFGPFHPLNWEKPIFRYWRSLAFVVERVHNSRTHEEYVDYFRDLFHNEESWSRFSDSLHRMKTMSGKANMKLFAVVFPLFGLPLDESYPFQSVHEKIGAELDAMQVPHIDLFQAYRNIPSERLQIIPGSDTHPNEIAHRIAAEKIFQGLRKFRMMPAAVKTPRRRAQRIDPYLTSPHARHVSLSDEQKSVPSDRF